MKTKTITSGIGPALPAVLRELAEKLTADDWARWATDDDTSFYYILGMGAYTSEQDAEVDHLSLSIPGGRPISVVGERQVHAQVASSKPASYYLRQARSRLEATGIESGLVDRFLEFFDAQDIQEAMAGWPSINVPGTDRFDAFINFLHALAMRRGVAIDELATGPERTRELENAAAKTYLNELSGLFAGVVKRAVPLEGLTFEDKHLNEASRCYLYGFLKATVVLSSTAVERCLRDAIGEAGLERVAANVKAKKGGFYGLLVQEAIGQDVLGPRE
ncbi:MAG: hypothetical protein Q7R30_05300 [Acidobacteriota bacterium]|nr:hypothetical protein [Acidobacteriota bacterium]